MSTAPTSPVSLTIATRESRLAMWQAEHVQALLQAQGHSVALLGMTTQGDQILDRSLSKVGGKGLFVKELEVALEEPLVGRDVELGRDEALVVRAALLGDLRDAIKHEHGGQGETWKGWSEQGAVTACEQLVAIKTVEAYG